VTTLIPTAATIRNATPPMTPGMAAITPSTKRSSADSTGANWLMAQRRSGSRLNGGDGERRERIEAAPFGPAQTCIGARWTS